MPDHLSADDRQKLARFYQEMQAGSLSYFSDDLFTQENIDTIADDVTEQILAALKDVNFSFLELIAPIKILVKIFFAQDIATSESNSVIDPNNLAKLLGAINEILEPFAKRANSAEFIAITKNSAANLAGIIAIAASIPIDYQVFQSTTQALSNTLGALRTNANLFFATQITAIEKEFSALKHTLLIKMVTTDDARTIALCDENLTLLLKILQPHTESFQKFGSPLAISLSEFFESATTLSRAIKLYAPIITAAATLRKNLENAIQTYHLKNTEEITICKQQMMAEKLSLCKKILSQIQLDSSLFANLTRINNAINKLYSTFLDKYSQNKSSFLAPVTNLTLGGQTSKEIPFPQNLPS